MFKCLAPLLALTFSTSALAGVYCTLRGPLTGMTTAASFDLDGDGNNARTGTLRSKDFVVDVVVDTMIDTTPECPAPQAEIIPSGHAVFSTPDGKSAIFTTVDSSRHLCLGSGTEEVSLKITGGRGAYAGATGTGSARFIDDVTLESSPSGFPRVVFTFDGSFTLRVR